MNDAELFAQDLVEEEGQLDIICEIYDKEAELSLKRQSDQGARDEELRNEVHGTSKELLESIFIRESYLISYEDNRSIKQELISKFSAGGSYKIKLVVFLLNNNHSMNLSPKTFCHKSMHCNGSHRNIYFTELRGNPFRGTLTSTIFRQLRETSYGILKSVTHSADCPPFLLPHSPPYGGRQPRVRRFPHFCAS